MTKKLSVTILKDGESFLTGDFSVRDPDYDAVRALLDEVDMDRGQAASILSGYMHARDVGKVTEDMGKIALFAAVYLIDAGEDAIKIPL